MASFRVSLPALLVGLTLSQAALPIGFGELQIQSRLNQPLQAEIPVLGVSPSGVESIKVRLGGREDFAAMGLDYRREVDALAVELVVRNDQVVLQLRGREALREPLLNLVLVAEDGSTRMLRDYAVLLDLPDAELQVRSLPQPAAIAPEAISPEMAPTSTMQTPEAPVQTGIAAPADALRYGPTRVGDSLSTIAHRLGKARGDEWHAFGVALYIANPEAFIAGDPNRLKAAMSLQLPTPETVARYSRRDWNALFAGALPPIAQSHAAQTTPEATTNSPVSEAAVRSSPAVATTIKAPAPEIPSLPVQDTGALADLRRENVQLRNELAATETRMLQLEQRLAELDARQQALLTANAAVPLATATIIDAPAVEAPIAVVDEPISATDPTAVLAVTAVTPSPVAVEIRDQLAADAAPTGNGRAEASTSNVPAAAEARALRGESSIGSIWSTVLLPLLLLLGLTAAGALFWFWYERRNRSHRRHPTARAIREPRPVLPLAQAEERSVETSDAGSPDRRALKMKQIQAALDTYVSYQRLDRAIELLEQESQHAGDDLVLRRHLQKILKDIRRQHQQWQEKQQAQLLQQFDTATSTQTERSSTRDDSLKSSG